LKSELLCWQEFSRGRAHIAVCGKALLADWISFAQQAEHVVSDLLLECSLFAGSGLVAIRDGVE
jgi:hypothetical protein